jgi:hypothetical protein
MSWILIGIVAGSFIVSGHDSEEACLGRKAVLEKQKIAAECVAAPHNFGSATGTFLYLNDNNTVPVH